MQLSYQELHLNSCDIETLAGKYLVLFLPHGTFECQIRRADKLRRYDAEALQKMYHPGGKDKGDDYLNIQKMSIKYFAGSVQSTLNVPKS